MEVQLQELIEQIKKDGVEVAEQEAKEIVESARSQAEKIVAQAQSQAEKILADARAENERLTKSSEDAIRQAGRNLLISFREGVTKEIRAITAENVSSVFSSDALAKLIISAVECWAKKPEADDITVILNNDELKQLEQHLLAAFKERALGGVTLKANDNFDEGFRIAVKDSSVYYDYSADAVVDMLSGYLSPRVTELLKEA